MIVRLKVKGEAATLAVLYPFKFYASPIKTTTDKATIVVLIGFNSMIVRLKFVGVRESVPPFLVSIL